MVVEFFEVVVDGFRWFKVVPCFSNYACILIIIFDARADFSYLSYLTKIFFLYLLT